MIRGVNYRHRSSIGRGSTPNTGSTNHANRAGEVVRNCQSFKGLGTARGGSSGSLDAATRPTRGLDAAIDGFSEFTNLVAVSQRG
jgi:hypothetical protein